MQKKVGILPKDTSSGPFIDEWKKVYGTISKDMEEVDISTALSSAALAVKDENELVGYNGTLDWDILICVIASHAKCLESLYRPYESLFRRRNVERVG